MNIQKKKRLLNNIRNSSGVPYREFNKIVDIIKDMVYLDTPDDMIIRAINGGLDDKRILRVIEVHKQHQKDIINAEIVRVASKLENPEDVKEAQRQERLKKQRDYQNPIYLRNRTNKQAIAKIQRKREMAAIMKETESQMSKVKPRKKVVKTFWNTPVKNHKYKSNGQDRY